MSNSAARIAAKVALYAVLLIPVTLTFAIPEPSSLQSENKLPSPDRQQIVRLLEQRDFISLEKLLAGYIEEFDRTPHDSVSYRDAFEHVTQVDSQMAARFDEWVTQFPNSYSAHLARGGFFFEQGTRARGTQFVDKVEQEQFHGMAQFFEKAIAELNLAERLSAKPYLVYRYTMGIAMHAGDSARVRAIFDLAAKLAPRDFILRSRYLNSLTPRWGGNYRAMESFVEETRKAGLGASEISRLAAQIPADQGDESFRTGNFRNAIQDLSKAISADPRPAWFCTRGNAYWRLNELTLAQTDFEQGLKLDPRDKQCNEAFANYLRAIGNHQRAIEPLSQLIEIAPNSTLYMNRGHSYEAQDMFPQALSDYQISAKQGNVFSQTRVAMFYWYAKGVMAKDSVQAVYWGAQAVRSGHPDAQRFIGLLRQRMAKGDNSAGLFLREIENRKGP